MLKWYHPLLYSVAIGQADERYFQEATLKSAADIKKFATGAKFNSLQTLHGLTRIFTNYICLLEVLFGNQCHHLHWGLRLRDGLDLHKGSREFQVTPLWQVHQDSQQFFDASEKWDDV